MKGDGLGLSAEHYVQPGTPRCSRVGQLAKACVINSTCGHFNVPQFRIPPETLPYGEHTKQEHKHSTWYIQGHLSI